MATFTKDKTRVVTKWMVNESGTIKDALEAFGGALSTGSEMEDATLLAPQQDSNGNHLHYLTNLGVGRNNMKHFQWHLRKENLTSISWMLKLEQGVPIAGLNIISSENNCMRCNNCQGSILDLHRSCANCLFKLCVTCCIEFRDGSRRSNGAIVCPPKSLGGCGCRNLELTTRYPTNWVSEMLVKAEAATNVGNLTGSIEAAGMACLGSSQEAEQANHLHCPTALGIKENDLKHFRWHMQRGEPVVVHDVLNGATGLSWEPMVMWRACRKPRNPDQHLKKLTVYNCLSMRKETVSIHQFFKGYAEGLFDAESRLKILKLDDWPPAESFQEQLPRQFVEFVRCLPLMLYTHPHAGYLNMLTRIPMVSSIISASQFCVTCCVEFRDGGRSENQMMFLRQPLSVRIALKLLLSG